MKIQKMVVTVDEARSVVRNALDAQGLQVDTLEIVHIESVSEFNRMLEAIVNVKRAFPLYRTSQKIDAIKELRRISALGDRTPMGLAEAKLTIEALA
jgi:ribosomal protein L7/L12